MSADCSELQRPSSGWCSFEFLVLYVIIGLRIVSILSLLYQSCRHSHSVGLKFLQLNSTNEQQYHTLLSVSSDSYFIVHTVLVFY
ncbi:hypothetical protein HanRHA438_Chr10g0471611 [Helianthus annuus]|nr:hypothetical protein HanRHA438_Chr10g0471611 [Helianthus annuus]